VANLFATVLLRGSEKGLVLYYDFDFEATDATPPREVRNKARRKRAGASVAALTGPARLVLLQAPYQLQKVAKVAHTAARLEPESREGGGGLRGEVKAKCLEFEDGKAEACIMLCPAEVVPESKLSLTMWVRSGDRGLGTILSYAAHRRRAFNVRVTHKGSSGAEEAQKKKGAEEEEKKEIERLIRVDGSMRFMDLLAKLKENFGELRFMWLHALYLAACALCGSSALFLLAKLKENFGELRFMWLHALYLAACALCGSSALFLLAKLKENFCELVSLRHALGSAGVC
jgi:hypothetical protein